jgi:hypothetical protein
MKKLVLLFSIALISIATQAQNTPIKGMVNGATEVVTIFDAEGHLAIGNVGPVGDKITITQFNISTLVNGKANAIKAIAVEAGEAKLTAPMRESIKGCKGNFYVEEIKGINKNGEIVTLKPLKCKL